MNFDHLELFSKSELNIAIEVMHSVIDHFCGRGNLSYQKYGEIWSLEEWWDMTEDWLQFCKHCVKESLPADEVSEKLDSLAKELQKEASDVVGLRKDEIRTAMITSTTQSSSAYLRDFDWKVKLVMSSDKLAKINEPLASVDFDIESRGEGKHLSLELTKDELKKLITSLEGAQKAVTQLKV